MLIFLLGLETLGNHLKRNTPQFSQGEFEMRKIPTGQPSVCLRLCQVLEIQCRKHTQFLPPGSLPSSEGSLTKNHRDSNMQGALVNTLDKSKIG